MWEGGGEAFDCFSGHPTTVEDDCNGTPHWLVVSVISTAAAPRDAPAGLGSIGVDRTLHKHLFLSPCPVCCFTRGGVARVRVVFVCN